MISSPDDVVLAFSEGSVWGLSAVLAAILFAIALDLTPAAFRALGQQRRILLTGLALQFIAVPALGAGLALGFAPTTSVGLGMVIVAACPGGPLSNYLVHLANGDVALSVALTALGTVLALVLMPVNIAVWGGWVAPDLLQQVTLDPGLTLGPMLMVLGAVAAGVLLAQTRPGLAARLRKPLQRAAFAVFVALVLAGLMANRASFDTGALPVMALVLVQFLAALMIGWFVARLVGAQAPHRPSLAIDTAVQNPALALVVIFATFGSVGGAAVIAALWGAMQAALGGVAALALRRARL